MAQQLHLHVCENVFDILEQKNTQKKKNVGLRNVQLQKRLFAHCLVEERKSSGAFSLWGQRSNRHKRWGLVFTLWTDAAPVITDDGG